MNVRTHLLTCAVAALSWGACAAPVAPPAPTAGPAAKRVNYSDRTGLWLKIGEATDIQLGLVNHTPDSIDSLRIAVETDAAWLQAEMTGDCKPLPGQAGVWSAPRVEGGGGTLKLIVSVTVLGSSPAAGGQAAVPTKLMDQANLRFKVWRDDRAGGTAGHPVPASAIPARSAWHMVYLVRSAPADLAKAPLPMEWHLVEAAPGEFRPLTVKIQNLNPNEPLKNVTAIPVSDQKYVALATRKEGMVGDMAAWLGLSDWVAGRKIPDVRTDASVSGIPGLNVIPPTEEKSFTVNLQVAPDAVPGSTATVALDVRTSTPGTAPNPWIPFVLMQVEMCPYDLPGNFDAFVFYNLPPPPGRPPAPAGGAAEWIPLPKGTKVSIAQVYTLRGGEGVEKLVEQFIGYGNVIDDRGYVCCRIDPVRDGKPQMRLRIVADTIANEIELFYKGGSPGDRVVDRYRTLRPRCAVTPTGKRTFRNISHTFLVQATDERPEAKPGEQNSARIKQGKVQTFYSTAPGQNANFIDGRRILIPYYGYETAVNNAAKPGIAIEWEGELSTGGVINFFMDPSSPLGSGFDAVHTGAWSAVGMNPSQSGGDVNDEYNWQLQKSTEIGLIYHNQNELFAVLGALIRAQDYLSELPFFAIPADGKTPRRELPPVIAQWRRGREVANGETGYCLKDGVWRLLVQANPEDPDEGDTSLILRGYGAAVRHHFFQPSALPGRTAATPTAANYSYYRRTSLTRAWEEGFDIFFAAAVMGRGKVLNEFVGPGQEALRTARSVDLEDVLARAARARGPAIYDDSVRKIRGADNAVAVAAGLWAVSKGDSPRHTIQWILENGGASLGGYLDWVSQQDAGRLHPLVQLGVCPRVASAPPGFLYNDNVDPRTVDIVWDPNDVLFSGRIEGKLLLGADRAPVVAHTFDPRGREPQLFSLRQIADGRAGNAILAATGAGRGPVFWTIETNLGGKGTFRWPLQSFFSAPPSAPLDNGPRIPLGSNGSLSSPRMPGNASVATQTCNSVFDGRKLLGGEIHRIGFFASPEDERLADFPEPVTLELGWDEKEAVGKATPGIYFLDPAKGRWELAGTTPAGERTIRVRVTRAGAYALLVDAFPPSLEEVHAWPNPFRHRAAGAKWRLEAALSEPALLSLRILGGSGTVARVLADRQMHEQGELVFDWDGKDDQGRPVPDGLFSYELQALDESGLAGDPRTGRICVFNGLFGAAAGRVLSSLPNAPVPGVSLAGFNLETSADARGEYLLAAVPPGDHEVEFRCPGHFDEKRPVQIGRSGGEVRLPDVQMTHRAMSPVRASSVLFSPDGDGAGDFVSFRFAWIRACETEVEVLDAEGNRVRLLRPRQSVAPGVAALVWDGLDDEGVLLPSGWYKVAWTAYNRDEAIPQEEARVLLDRGLIQYASALPYLFSPNGDGFDDTLQVGFNLEQAASVSLAILGADGTRLHSVTNSVALEAGWRTLEWDGRGRGGRVLPDGRYQFELTPVYAGGYTSKVVRGEFQSDSMPPEIGQVSPANGVVVREARPRISARILSRLDDIDPSQLKFKIDENTVEADEVDLARGTFAYTPKTSLGPGVHIAIAYAQDWAGNYAPPQAVSFTIAFGEDPTQSVADRQAPEILSLTPAKNAKIYGDTPLITARVRDLGDGLDPENIRLTINGEVQANSVQRFIPGKSGKAWDWYYYRKAMLLFDPLEGEIRYVPVTPLPAGKTVVTLEVQDKAGNRSAKAESVFEVVIDRDSPTVEITRPGNGAVLSQPPGMMLARITETGPSGVNPHSIRCLLDNREIKPPDGGFPFDPATGLLQIPLSETLARDAQHLLAVSVRDRAGNLSRTAVSAFALVADGDAPRIDLLLPSAADRFEEGFPISIAAAVYDLGRSGLDPDGVEVLLNGKAVEAYDVASGRPGYVLSQNLLQYTFERLPAGHYVLEIRCRDRAGNAATPVVCSFEVLPR